MSLRGSYSVRSPKHINENQPKDCNGSSPLSTFDPPLEESAVLEVVLDDDVGDGVEHELDVVGVGGTREVGVDLLLVLALV